MLVFKRFYGNWTELRKYNPKEIDFHYGNGLGVAYWDAMTEVKEIVRDRLVSAQRDGDPYVLFTHGRSTSRRGRTTARSVVRGFMRSAEATPLIIRKECIQHQSAFLARVRQHAS